MVNVGNVEVQWVMIAIDHFLIFTIALPHYRITTLPPGLLAGGNVVFTSF